MNFRWRVVAGLLIALFVIGFVWLWNRHRAPANRPSPLPEAATTAVNAPSSGSAGTTRIHAHNLLLRKGPDFRVYVRWLEGRLARTRRDTNPSFDHPESFVLNVDSGVIRVNIGDIGHYLSEVLTDSPLKIGNLLADGNNLKLTGTVHKVVTLPVQVIASVSADPDDRIRVRLTKISVLKMPVKGLLGMFHISAADMFKTNVPGLQIQGNDLVLTTQELLPPPHIRGLLTQVRVDSPDIEAVFGNASQNVERVEMWRNFFSLKGGTIDFGNLTMHPVDIMMIDISTNPWFDLDLVNYRDQFTSGYTRITGDSGLQMFIPDRRDVPAKPVSQSDSIQWFKDRNIPPPSQIVQSLRH